MALRRSTEIYHNHRSFLYLLRGALIPSQVTRRDQLASKARLQAMKTAEGKCDEPSKKEKKAGNGKPACKNNTVGSAKAKSRAKCKSAKKRAGKRGAAENDDWADELFPAEVEVDEVESAETPEKPSASKARKTKGKASRDPAVKSTGTKPECVSTDAPASEAGLDKASATKAKASKGAPKTFARRYQPAAGLARCRWNSIKEAFNRDIADQVDFPSRHEDLK